MVFEVEAKHTEKTNYVEVRGGGEEFAFAIGVQGHRAEEYAEAIRKIGAIAQGALFNSDLLLSPLQILEANTVKLYAWIREFGEMPNDYPGAYLTNVVNVQAELLKRATHLYADNPHPCSRSCYYHLSHACEKCGKWMGRDVIYTFGHEEHYEEGMKEFHQEKGGYFKKGMTQDGYPGGSVFGTFEEAQAYLDLHNMNDHKVYGVVANWHTDTEPSKHGDFHDLLITSRLVQVKGEHLDR